MKSRIASTALLGLLLVGVGCGDTESSPVDAPEQTATPDPAAFPVEIEHQLGTTRIPEPPTRVVTVGLRDQEFTMALGVVPVGTTEWFGDYEGAIWPWAQDALGESEPPEVIGEFAELKFERIAALDPDLILGLYSGMTDRTYETLSEIAPTIADPKGVEDYTVSWQDQLALTAEALGLSEEGEKVQADIEDAFAEQRDELADIQGATAVYGGLGGAPGVYTSVDQRGRFLEDLGLDVPDEIDEGASDPFFAEISKEQFRIFDQDIAIIIGDGDVEQDFVSEEPLYGDLESVKEGRAIFINELEGLLSGALSFQSPLSLPYALEEMTPRFLAAADGDPETEVEPTPGPDDYEPVAD